MNYEVFLNRIDFLCKKNNIKKTIAFENCGIGKDFSVHIKKGSSPSIEKVESLASYFNTSIDYLIGRINEAEELIKRTPDNAVKVIDKIVFKSPNLSDEENEILKIFQALNKEGQEIILNTARGLEASGRYKKPDSSEGEKTS